MSPTKSPPAAPPSEDAAHMLDTRGLKCPLPVLKARRAMKEIRAGEVLEVQATDPGAVKDFEAFCAATGDALLSARQHGEVYIFRIRKGS